MLNDIASKSRAGFVVVRKPSSKLIAISLLGREFPSGRKEGALRNPATSQPYTHKSASPRGRPLSLYGQHW